MRYAIKIIMLSCGFWLAGCGGARRETEPNPAPLGIRFAKKDSSLPKNRQKYLTFTHAGHPGQHIGYRFFEHEPMACGAVPPDNAAAGIDPAAANRLEQEFAARANVFPVDYQVREEGWIPQDWRLYFAPARDGIDVLLVIQTHQQGLPELYAVQQCLRMSGETNSPWRQEVACTPAFSEYDLWAKEKNKDSKTSLSYIRIAGKWQPLPAMKEAVGARTALGEKYDLLCHNGMLPDIVGPYQAKMRGTMDGSSIARRSDDGTWVCGMLWQGTTHVTDHHPADCLHAVVNIGNIPACGKKAVRGKIYWFPGNLDDLTAKVWHDFPGK